MKKIIILLLLCITYNLVNAQFTGTDSLRNYNNRYITNNPAAAFTNLRLNTLLRGIIDWVDTARAGTGGGGVIGVDTLYALNDSTIRYRKNGVFRNTIIKGVYDNRKRVDTIYKVNDTTLGFNINNQAKTLIFPAGVSKNFSNATLIANGDYYQDWANHWFFLNNIKALDINSNLSDPNHVNNTKVFRLYADSTTDATALQLAWGLKDINNGIADSIHFELNSSKDSTYITHWVDGGNKYVKLNIDPHVISPALKISAIDPSKSGIYSFGSGIATLTPNDSIRLLAPAGIAATKMLALQSLNGNVGTVVAMDIPSGADSAVFATKYGVDTANNNLRTDIAGRQPAGNYITALTGDITATGPGSISATIANNVVTNTKIRQSGANTLVGNPTGSTANVQDISKGYGLAYSGTTLLADTSSTNHLVTQSDLNDSAIALRAAIGTGGSADSTDFSTNFRRDTAISNVRAEKNFKLGWFNVKEFGAVGDSVTDDTGPIQAAIIAAKNHNGGVIFFPNGFYRIGGAIISTFGGLPCNCQLYIPYTPADSSITIQFLAESPGNFELQGVTGVKPPKTGVILESSLASASAGDAILAVVKGPGDDTFTKTNSTDTWFEGINFRVRRDAGAFPLSGINLRYAGKTKLDLVKVDVNMSLDDAPDPTGTGSVGIVLPEKSNHAMVSIGTVRTAGFDVGMELGEHAVVQDYQNVCNNVGMTVTNADHSASIQTFEGELNKTNIRVDGDMNVSITNFNTEHYTGSLGTKWYNFVSDITFSSYTPYAATPGTFTIGNTNAGISGAIGTTVALVTNDSSRIAKLDRTWLNKGVILTQTPSASFEANMFRGLNPSTTISMVAGGNTNIDGSNGPFLALRGNTFSATATQRGNVYLGAGNVSSPGAGEGQIQLYTGNTIPRVTITNSGTVNISGLASSLNPSTTGDTRLLVADSTGNLSNNSVLHRNINNVVGLEVQNPNAGSAAESYLALRNDVSFGSLELNSSGNSNTPNRLGLISGPGNSNGLWLTTTSNAPIKLMTSSDGQSNTRVEVTGAGKLKVYNIDSTSTPVNMLYQDVDGTIKKTAVPAGGGGSILLGAFDGNTSDAKGASISGSTLYMQSASGSNPGLVNTSTQTIAGLKTYTGGIIHSKTSGTGEDFKWYNKPEGANLAIGALYPSTGTNVNMSLYIIPKGTGVSGFHSQLTVFNDDGIASGNYGAFSLRATGTTYDLISEKAGTGSILPIRVATSGNANQAYFNTNGNVLIGTNSDNTAGLLQVNGAITTVTDSAASPKNMAWIDTDGKLRKAAVPSGSSGITSLNGETGAAQSLVGGNGIVITDGTNTHTISGAAYALDKLYTDANNTGTSATDLFSTTTSANQLSSDGNTIRFESAGVNNDATATVNLQVQFAGNGIAGTGDVTISATGVWTVKGTIIRTSSTTARAYVVITMDGTTEKIFSTTANLTGLNFTTTNVLKLQATAGGAGGGSNDITGQMWRVDFAQ